MRTFATSTLIALAALSVSAHEGHDHGSEQVVVPPVESQAVEEPLEHSFEPTNIKGAFVEQFTDDWSKRWTPSHATKKTPVGGETFSYVGKWSVEESSVFPAISGDKGLVAKSKAAHHAISAPLAKPLSFADKPLVVQYEVKYQKGGNCGGGYLKLLEDGSLEGEEFSDKSKWVVMFGPDLTCPGTKVHFIFRHKNPVTGEYEEKHLKTPPTPHIQTTTMLYTLIVTPDNKYEILINDKSTASGSLLEDFDPPLNPPKQILDPEDKKPSDWVDDEKIPDPDATKPDDWDEDAPYEVLDTDAQKPEGWLDNEPETIPDPDAQKPEEWDDEEDGDWIAPTVRNPKCDEAPGCGEWKRPFKPNPDYKGKWYAPMIDNPAYKGPWEARKIDNPAYFEDSDPVKSLDKIGGVGIELWTMTEDILFDNIYIGHSAADAKALAKETFHVKEQVESAAKKAKEPKDDTSEEELDKTFAEAPAAFLRQKVFSFIELAKVDPVHALKTKPETAAALAAAILTLFGMLGTLFGVVGGAQKPVTKSSAKKTDAPSPDDKKAAAADKAPVAPAGGAKKDDGAAKKRK